MAAELSRDRRELDQLAQDAESAARQLGREARVGSMTVQIAGQLRALAIRAWEQANIIARKERDSG